MHQSAATPTARAKNPALLQLALSKISRFIEGVTTLSITSPIHETAQTATNEVIRELCEQNQAEPGAIWDALEAKGLDTTPGVVYQAMNAPAHPSAEQVAPG